MAARGVASYGPASRSPGVVAVVVLPVACLVWLVVVLFRVLRCSQQHITSKGAPLDAIHVTIVRPARRLGWAADLPVLVNCPSSSPGFWV